MAEPPRYSPLALIGLLVIVLLGFAAFFISFLIMPLLALAVFAPTAAPSVTIMTK